MKIIGYFVILLFANTLLSDELQRCGTVSPDSIPIISTEINQNYYLESATSICLPIVVHVIYNGSNQNISDAQIISQINVLNEDFRKMPNTNGHNTNQNGTDTHIEFRLSNKDPNGLNTNGITRHYSSQTIFSSQAADLQTLKNFAYWEPTKYINIWVVPSINNGILGFVTKFPWQVGSTDGIVIDNRCIGDNVGTTHLFVPYNLGRTLTHEMGHYLGLLHTFQGGCTNNNCQTQGDQVCDTPPVSSPNYYCLTNINSCHTDNPDLNDMVENYLDYSNDDCMNTFTILQSARIDYHIGIYRTGLISSNGLSNYDFLVFGNHIGDYEYKVTTSIITKSDVIYNNFTLSNGNSLIMESRKEIIINPGFIAEEGSNLIMSIDNIDIPPFPKQSSFESSTIQSNSIIISPNPLFDNAKIQIRIIPNTMFNLALYDLLGNKIIEFANNEVANTSQKEYILNSTNIPSGIYTIILQSDNDVVSERIAIIK